MKKILITGGAGRFANHIKNICDNGGNYKLLLPIKSEMDFRSLENCEKYFEEHKNEFDYVIHSGGLSSPMVRHKDNPTLSIQTNIIGTSNVAIACEKYKKKLIYISTNYVYPGIEGNHTEESELKPFNNYGWSKLGGECAVMHYDNTLILRACMNAVPFPHERAFIDVVSSHMYADEAAEVTLKLLDEVGVINLGGKAQTVYDFVVEHEPDVGKISVKEITNVEVNTNSSMNNDKMNKLIGK